MNGNGGEHDLNGGRERIQRDGKVGGKREREREPRGERAYPTLPRLWFSSARDAVVIGSTLLCTLSLLSIVASR